MVSVRSVRGRRKEAGNTQQSVAGRICSAMSEFVIQTTQMHPLTKV